MPYRNALSRMRWEQQWSLAIDADVRHILGSRVAYHASPESTGEFVYVANTGSDNVSAYSIDPSGGALKKVAGSPFKAGNAAGAVAVDPTGKFAYVVNQNYPKQHGHVYVYSINARTGALKFASYKKAGTSPYAITIYRSGFVYVPNIYSNDVSAYTINETSGKLTPIGGSPFNTCCQPETIVADPAGGFVYVPNTETNDISAYAINPSSGALRKISGSPYSAGTTPEGPAIDPTGSFLYVPNINSNNISIYRINPRTGSLTEIPGSPLGTGTNPDDVAIDPAGKFAYVTNAGDNNVSGYTINPNSGALKGVPGSPFSAGSGPEEVTVGLAKFVYVTNSGSNNVSAYIINQNTGALKPVAGSPFAAGTMPKGIAATSPQ